MQWLIVKLKFITIRVNFIDQTRLADFPYIIDESWKSKKNLTEKQLRKF